MKTRALVTCRHCHGSGKVQLDTPHQVTLDVVNKSWQTVAEIRVKLGGISMQSVFGRLEKLLKLGLVQKQYEGRSERSARGHVVNGRSGDVTQWRLK